VYQGINIWISLHIFKLACYRRREEQILAAVHSRAEILWSWCLGRSSAK